MTQDEITIQSFAMLIASELAPFDLTAKLTAHADGTARLRVWRDAGDVREIPVERLTHAEVRRVAAAARNLFLGGNGHPM